MLGSLLSRAFIMVLGYAYPAYQCYKVVEKNKPDIDQLRFWCQYWILVALVTVVERIGDMIISWLPMYHEAKLAFFIYLWHPKTMGTSYIYNGFFQPYLSQHEADIDQNILELRIRATDVIFSFWRQGATYGQTRFFEILQYFASQSQSLRSRPAQKRQQEQQQQQVSQPPPIVPTRQPSRHKQPPQQQQLDQHFQQANQPPAQEQLEEDHPQQKGLQQPRAHRMMRSRTGVSSAPEQLLSSPTDSSPTKSQSSETAMEDAPSAVHVTLSSQVLPGKENSGSVNNSESSEREISPTESPIISENEDSNLTPREVMMEDAIRVTRARLRRNISTRTQEDSEAAL